jgi:hypothetical protein
MSRVLIVANQTLGGEDLLEFVRDRIAAGPPEFTLLVPATPRAHRNQDTRVPGINVPLDTEDDDYAEARRRLDQGLDALHSLGATAEGSVGDPDPLKAVQEVLARRPCDEIILSTLPSGVSRWLGQDLPHKLERKFHLPVTVVTAGQRARR